MCLKMQVYSVFSILFLIFLVHYGFLIITTSTELLKPIRRDYHFTFLIEIHLKAAKGSKSLPIYRIFITLCK